MEKKTPFVSILLFLRILIYSAVLYETNQRLNNFFCESYTPHIYTPERSNSIHNIRQYIICVQQYFTDSYILFTIFLYQNSLYHTNCNSTSALVFTFVWNHVISIRLTVWSFEVSTFFNEYWLSCANRH